MLPEAESSRKVSERKLSQKNQPRSPPDLRLLASAEVLMSILQPLYMTLICILILWFKIWLMTNKGLMSWDKIWPEFRTRWQRCIYCRLKNMVSTSCSDVSFSDLSWCWWLTVALSVRRQPPGQCISWMKIQPCLFWSQEVSWWGRQTHKQLSTLPLLLLVCSDCCRSQSLMANNWMKQCLRFMEVVRVWENNLKNNKTWRPYMMLRLQGFIVLTYWS